MRVKSPKEGLLCVCFFLGVEDSPLIHVESVANLRPIILYQMDAMSAIAVADCFRIHFFTHLSSLESNLQEI